MNTAEIKLELFRQIDVLPENIILELKKVVQSFSQQHPKTATVIDTDISGLDIQTLIENNAAFDFLKANEEDIYSDADLKVKY